MVCASHHPLQRALPPIALLYPGPALICGAGLWIRQGRGGCGRSLSPADLGRPDPSCLWKEGATKAQFNISRPHSLCANAVGFGIFPGVFQLFIRCAKILFPGAGGICILFETCVKRPFQKCMGWGGIGAHIFEYRDRTFRRFRVFRPQAAPLTRADTNSQVFPWVLRHIVELEQSERR